MFAQGFQLLVAVLALLLPGLLVLLALGIRERLWWAGLSAPLTMGLVLVTGVLTGVTGIRFGVWSFSVVVVLAAAIAFGVRRSLDRRRPSEGEGIAPGPLSERAPSERTLSGRPLFAARAAGAIFGLAGIGLGVLTWKRGLGTWSTPTQEHDPVTHSMLTAFIHFTGKAAPWQVLPVDVVNDTAVQFYPPGFSSMAALLVGVAGDAMTALNLVTVVSAAVVLPLSVAALAAAVLRHTGLGRGWTEPAGGVAVVVAAVLYRPSVSFAHDGGILANSMAMAMVPGLVAVMLVIRKRQWAAALAIGLATAGVLAVHPSAAVSVGLTLAAAWIGLLFTRPGRAQVRQSFFTLVVAAVVAGVCSVPVIRGMLSLGSGVGDSIADIDPAPLRTAIGAVVRLPYAGYFDRSGLLGQPALGVLALGGALAVVVFRKGWPILTAWLVWAVITLAFHLSPNSGVGAIIGRFFYRVGTRIDSHMYEMIPVLVACLFVLPAAALYGLHLTRPPLVRARPFVAIGGIVVVLGALLATTFTGYYQVNARALAQRYVTPEFSRYDASDYAAVNWLHDHERPGETILNSANDGSTLAYVEYGLPILSTLPDGRNPIADRVTLLRSFNAYPHDPRIQAILRQMNVQWVYVDSQAPLIDTDSTHWNGGGLYALAPGLKDLAGLPGLTTAFHSGTVTVYHLDLGKALISP
jgi:hypothetical protein